MHKLLPLFSKACTSLHSQLQMCCNRSLHRDPWHCSKHYLTALLICGPKPNLNLGPNAYAPIGWGAVLFSSSEHDPTWYQVASTHALMPCLSTYPTMPRSCCTQPARHRKTTAVWLQQTTGQTVAKGQFVIVQLQRRQHHMWWYLAACTCSGVYGHQ